MLRKINEFAATTGNKEEAADLSDDDFFDMGQYTLDKEHLLNPNSKLHNLFGGLKQLESTHPEKMLHESSEEKLVNFDKDYDFSDSEADQQDKSLYGGDDDRPFANMYSMNTNVEYAVNKAHRTSPSKFQNSRPSPSPKKKQ